MDAVAAGSSSSIGVPRRTFGVEEEFLLVDEATAELTAVAQSSLAPIIGDDSAAAGRGLESQQEQLETITPVCSSLNELTAAVRAGRERADATARHMGARAVALGTSVAGQSSQSIPLSRYLPMEDRFRIAEREQLTCGLYVHVAVSSSEEGVGVLDRIRIWLPVLLALSVNSPYWHGGDSGFESYRYQVWSRWPSAGPCEIFGSAAAYRGFVEQLLGSRVVPDEKMVHFDARLSRNHPAIEIRVADVCLRASHTVALAALARALVETAACEWQTGVPAPGIPAAELRLAGWQASRSGVDKDLLHPVHRVPCLAPEVVQDLLEHVRVALAGFGDEAQVRKELASILRDGTGSRRQRQVFAQTGSRMAVMADAIACTHRDFDTPGTEGNLPAAVPDLRLSYPSQRESFLARGSSENAPRP